MEAREILFGDEALKRIQAGMDVVADAVKVTLGPRGRNFILYGNPEYELPQIINDGVRIAREIQPEGSFEKAGATIIKRVAEKTNDVAGDGTTTATILMQAIVRHGLQQLGNGADAVTLRRGIERATKLILKDLTEQAVETKDLNSLISVATVSCGDPVLGKLVAEVVHKLGVDGVVVLDNSETEETTVDITEGLELRGGWQLPIFITHPARQVVQFNKVPIFVTDHDLTNGLEMVKIMEIAGAHGHKEAVIIANSIQGEAMVAAVANRAQQKFNLVPIRVQAWGETGQDLLRDVAAVTGAKFFSKEEGNNLPQGPNDSYNWDDFGFAGSFVATKERTTIIDGGGDREARIKEVSAQIPNIKVAFRKEQVQERVARLRSGVATISIGAVVESERDERRLRVEDAINATKAALASGIVTGGGAALFRAADKVRLAETGIDNGFAVILKACEAPIRQIAENSGFELSSAELAKIAENPKLTIDFTTGKTIDGVKTGIIDPVMVEISALKNASSEAALFLTAAGAVVAKEKTA